MAAGGEGPYDVTSTHCSLSDLTRGGQRKSGAHLPSRLSDLTWIERSLNFYEMSYWGKKLFLWDDGHEDHFQRGAKWLSFHSW